MTNSTELNKDLKTRDYLANRLRDLEMLFAYTQQSVSTLIDYLVTDYGFERADLKNRPAIEIWGELESLQSEYGVGFDYVAAGTFERQRVGYFRYQLSYGGPAEEFRFFVDPEHNLIRAEFWLLDWFTGSCIDCTSQQTVKSIWEHFKDTESSRYAFRRAMTET